VGTNREEWTIEGFFGGDALKVLGVDGGVASLLVELLRVAQDLFLEHRPLLGLRRVWKDFLRLFLHLLQRRMPSLDIPALEAGDGRMASITKCNIQHISRDDFSLPSIPLLTPTCANSACTDRLSRFISLNVSLFPCRTSNSRQPSQKLTSVCGLQNCAAYTKIPRARSNPPSFVSRSANRTATSFTCPAGTVSIARVQISRVLEAP